MSWQCNNGCDCQPSQIAEISITEACCPCPEPVETEYVILPPAKRKRCCPPPKRCCPDLEFDDRTGWPCKSRTKVKYCDPCCCCPEESCCSDADDCCEMSKPSVICCPPPTKQPRITIIQQRPSQCMPAPCPPQQIPYPVPIPYPVMPPPPPPMPCCSPYGFSPCSSYGCLPYGCCPPPCMPPPCCFPCMPMCNPCGMGFGGMCCFGCPGMGSASEGSLKRKSSVNAKPSQERKLSDKSGSTKSGSSKSGSSSKSTDDSKKSGSGSKSGSKSSSKNKSSSSGGTGSTNKSPKPSPNPSAKPSVPTSFGSPTHPKHREKETGAYIGPEQQPYEDDVNLGIPRDSMYQDGAPPQ